MILGGPALAADAQLAFAFFGASQPKVGFAEQHAHGPRRGIEFDRLLEPRKGVLRAVEIEQRAAQFGIRLGRSWERGERLLKRFQGFRGASVARQEGSIIQARVLARALARRSR